MTPQRMGQQARGWRGVPDRHLLDTQETQTLTQENFTCIRMRCLGRHARVNHIPAWLLKASPVFALFAGLS